jgi:adenylosuccinate synthase
VTSQAWIVIDLGFGDSGKGTITDFLVRDQNADLVVRFNGGAQAGHNVVTPEGRHHTFSQFGSGSFVPGVGTHLGPGCVLHPGGMLVEAEALARVGVADILARTTVDADALLVSPFQQAAGRLRESLRGPAHHGTCGVGVGEAVRDALAEADDTLRAADLTRPAVLRRALARQQARKRSELTQGANLDDPRAVPEWAFLSNPSAVERVLPTWARLANKLRLLDTDQAATRIRVAKTVVFEGAHGLLLDEIWGFHPHTTWHDCTPAGAQALLVGLDVRVTRLGVLRAYATRHGPGPFPTEDRDHDAARLELHNDDSGWQGPFRTGPLDVVLLRYGMDISGGIDGLAVTCLDRMTDTVPLCLQYRVAKADPELVICDHCGGAIRLRHGRARDLSHRERLRTLLERVKPTITHVQTNSLVPTLEWDLGIPVWIESRGPRAVEKLWKKRPG